MNTALVRTNHAALTGAWLQKVKKKIERKTESRRRSGE